VSGIVGSKDLIKNGEVQKAVRRALNIFDKWVECTGAITEQTSIYYEIQGCIEDAVHCGVQAAMGLNVPLDSEKE
jgi:hypothetical protein